MPTYVYACKNCGHRFEQHQSFSDDALTVCPECHEPTLRKVFNSVGIVFKGSGFYKTDSRSDGRSSTVAGAGEGSASEKGAAASGSGASSSTTGSAKTADGGSAGGAGTGGANGSPSAGSPSQGAASSGSGSAGSTSGS